MQRAQRPACPSGDAREQVRSSGILPRNDEKLLISGSGFLASVFDLGHGLGS